MIRIVYLLPIVGALLGAFVLLTTLSGAQGAPQEAAGAAIACALGLLPYVFARAVHIMYSSSPEAGVDRIVSAVQSLKASQAQVNEARENLLADR